MAIMKCPSCGRDVEVSEALYCPFCGQTLRRVFADGSTIAPQASTAPIPGSIPATPQSPTSSASTQSQPPAGWTPYPEQSAFQPVPAAEHSALGATPAARLIRNQAVVASALAVMAICALFIFERVRIWELLNPLPGPFYVRFIVFSELPYVVMALAASYWLAWWRLAQRRPSHITLEATALSVLMLVVEPVLIILVLKVIGPSYYHGVKPLDSWTYLTAHVSLFLWILLLSLAFGALGVRLAKSCAEWSLIRQHARPASPIADFFKVFGACALLLIAAAVVISRTHIGSVFAQNVVVVAAPVVATLLAARSGKRRLGHA